MAKGFKLQSKSMTSTQKIHISYKTKGQKDKKNYHLLLHDNIN